jgi:hypothetical protein
VPTSAIAVTDSPATATPSTIATTGTKYTVTEPRAAPTRPTSVVNRANAMPVLSPPSTTIAATADHDHVEEAAPTTPCGVTSTSATSCARQITGSAPLRSSRGTARLNATP